MTVAAWICGILLAAMLLAFLAFGLWDDHIERRAYLGLAEPPTEEFPAVTPDAGTPVADPATEVLWEARQEAFALYVQWRADLAGRLVEVWAERERCLTTPTAAYKAVVAENFGVALADVGPREVDIYCTRAVWDVDSGGWTQATLELDGVAS